MAKIPDVRSIGTTQARADTRVVSMRNPGAMGAAISSFGESLTDAVDANTRYQASKAKSQLIIARNKLDNDRYEDVDHADIPSTYEQRFKQAQSDIAESISNPLARRVFEQEAALSYEAGLEKARQVAWGRERDTERGALTENLTALREASLTGDMLESAETVDFLLQSAADKGYIAQAERAKMLESWRKDAAVGKLKMLDPADRVSALRESWAQNLPSDTRAQLTREAKAADRELKAQLYAETAIADGKSRVEALNEALTLKDPELRDETVSRINTDYDRQKRIESETQNTAYEDYAAKIDVDGMAYEDIPEDDLRAMSPGMRKNLRSISNDRFNPRTNSDPDMLIELSAAAATRDWDEYNRLIRDESSRLSATDRVKYTVKGFESQLPKAADDGLSDVQAVVGALSSAGIEDTKKQKPLKDRLVGEIGRWRIRETERTGNEPSDKDRQQFIDSMLLEHDRGWMDAEKPLIKRDPLERIEVLRESDPDLVDTAAAYFAGQGVDPSPGQLLDMVIRFRGAR
ncbi:hypothetical protein [Litorivivens sp.]|uniref:hypothetical protein n=1 Tax=Litorivivens sp. TaxID=2020868 RepID=UPI003563D68C